ncbi:MAG: FecR family protein [Bacteroidota bacterium]
MQRQEIKDLIKKYNSGGCSEEEKSLLETWYLQFEYPELKDLSERERTADLTHIWNSLPINKNKVFQFKPLYRVAAMLFICLFVGLYIYNKNKESNQEQIIQTIAQNLKSGGTKAILTLSSGKQIVLSDSSDGELASQQGASISKTSHGTIKYLPENTSAKQLVYNVMETPAGGTYEITLSDGTKVTLDASSSIKYPVNFLGNERNVAVTGQAYFKVSHNAKKPFRVTTKGQTIEVLGTEFNINGYTDDTNLTTTLINGSIKITNQGQIAFLKPGQQSIIKQGSSAVNLDLADLETSISWKNGIFKFKRASLQTVMQQFARWYDVEIVYEGSIPNYAITGKVSRNANASQVLQIVSKLGVKFKKEGKKIVILGN